MSKAIYISPIDGKPGKPGQVYYPLSLRTLPRPSPQGRELLVKLTAASLNHRDLFLRQHLYPGVTFDVPLLADGVGVVVGVGPDVSNPDKWQGNQVILNPGVGWKDSPDGPEEATGYRIMGGTKVYDKGTLQEYITIEDSEVEVAPKHLSDAEAAALPLTGLTAWRALVTKAGDKNSKDGSAVLITGIGGGVALMALRFAVARGADVFVTSSNEEKIQKAVELGAMGGVSYKEEGWDKKVLGMLPSGKKSFDAIIDGAGGDSIEKAVKLVKTGGVLSVYGMTVSPKMPFPIQAVLKNIDVRGSTMGSRKEFKEMVEFVDSKKIHPVISRVLQTELDDLAAIDGLFVDMKQGKQFGKLVIDFGTSSSSRKL
ncbi:Putative Alcohol dehydrogenase [Penicillium brasilianum]|uniref:Putative Alcohol dehydrogenase n=1 Tax=Penicillium brasilianum TaxID=104259 RepID=A0A0F7U071_PENBI|nr:Putative Alcohol dehydrogenase [Penicillium brasilianum]